MKDNDDGTLADEFVSQGSSALEGANNGTVPVGSNDATGYFCGHTAGQATGLRKNHYGAVRSAAALSTSSPKVSAPPSLRSGSSCRESYARAQLSAAGQRIDLGGLRVDAADFSITPRRTSQRSRGEHGFVSTSIAPHSSARFF